MQQSELASALRMLNHDLRGRRIKNGIPRILVYLRQVIDCIGLVRLSDQRRDIIRLWRQNDPGDIQQSLIDLRHRLTGILAEQPDVAPQRDQRELVLGGPGKKRKQLRQEPLVAIATASPA